MKFHLSLDPLPFAQKINHTQKIFLLGSCFTENIGNKLLQHKFDVIQNPNGILFNPVSVANAIEKYISNEETKAVDLFFLNEAFHSWDHHSRFSSPDKEHTLIKINHERQLAHHHLKNAYWLIITLGSAFIYELTENAENYCPQRVAANNHKAPASWFQKRLLRHDEIHAVLDNLLFKLRVFNPGLKVIFTISPVRHIREGFVENNRSKSMLNMAVHAMADKMSNVIYFPAYELVIDDLRDYRFYAEDMVHPNYAATNYVWEKFIQCAMSDDTLKLMQEINEVNAAASHTPFNPESQAHAAFKAKNLQKIAALKHRFPFLDFSKEIAFFS